MSFRVLGKIEAEFGAEVARLVDCEAAIFICGERPGLGFADSLSAYYIYKPASGATDATRVVGIFITSS